MIEKIPVINKISNKLNFYNDCYDLNTPIVFSTLNNINAGYYVCVGFTEAGHLALLQVDGNRVTNDKVYICANNSNSIDKIKLFGTKFAIKNNKISVISRFNLKDLKQLCSQMREDGIKPNFNLDEVERHCYLKIWQCLREQRKVYYNSIINLTYFHVKNDFDKQMVISKKEYSLKPSNESQFYKDAMNMPFDDFVDKYDKIYKERKQFIKDKISKLELLAHMFKIENNLEF